MSGAVSVEPRFRVRLLGAPSVVDADGQRVSGLTTGKTVALLAYLLVNGEASRAEAVALLWGDSPEANARNAFRQTLHRLRGLLQEELAGRGEIIRPPNGGTVWCDVVDFREALHAGRVDEAIELYRGDFLAGFDVGAPEFEHWADGERATLRTRFGAALESAAQQALAEGNHERCVRYARLLAELNPLDADSAELHAVGLASAGRVKDAVASLRRFLAHSQSELGSMPGAVQALLDRLTGRSDAPVAGGHAEAPPLVGREAELGRLLAGSRSAAAGNGGTVVVSGTGGVGKTRLLEEFIRRVSALAPMLLLRGGDVGGARIPFAEIALALRPLVRAPGIGGASTHLLAEAARLLPELRDRFDLPPATAVEDEAARLRFFEGIAAMIEAVAYETPVCLVLDDAELASPATHELLAYLSARLRGNPVLLVIAWSEAPTAWLRTPAQKAVTELALGPLAEEAATELAALELERAGLGRDQAERVAMVANGDPLRIQEAVRRLALGDALISPPATLREIFQARWVALSQAERRLSTVAALLRQPAHARLLAAAAHLPERAVADILPQLVQEGLLEPGPDGTVIMPEAAAGAILSELSENSQRMHADWAATAAAAEGGFHPAKLAELMLRAGRAREAFSYLRAAGGAAAAAGAFDEAARHFREALDVAPDDAARESVQRDLDRIGRPLPLRLAAGPAPVRSTDARMWAWRVSRQWLAGLAALAALALVAVWVGRDAGNAGLRLVELQDTLLLSSGANVTDELFYLTGDLEAPQIRRWPGGDSPAWLAEVSLPWMNALVAPDGRSVALERATAAGTRLFIVRADQSDTTEVRLAPGDILGAGWSPDAAWLLLLHGSAAGGAYRSRLVAYHVATGTVREIGTGGTGDDVSTAAWSPTGLHVAWTRRGPSGAEDLLVAPATGSEPRMLATGLAAGEHIAWSPQGTHIAFVRAEGTERHVFLVDVASRQTRRLTLPAGEFSHPLFSPDGRFLAYEGVTGGDRALFISPSLGGESRRLAGADNSLTLTTWRGAQPPYVDRLRVTPVVLARAGERAPIAVSALDQRGESMPLVPIEFTSLDDSIAAVSPSSRSGDGVWVVEARRPGVARVVASAAGWRLDTAYVRVGFAVIPLASERFETAEWTQRWTGLGVPPVRGGTGTGIWLEGAPSWDAGVLSRASFPLALGMDVRADVFAPAGFRAAPNAHFALALVAPEDLANVDAAKPQFLQVAAIHWLGDAGRIAYSVGREVWTEPQPPQDTARALSVRIVASGDGEVRFFVNDQLRWSPAARVAAGAHVQLWIAGRSPGSPLRLDAVRAVIPGGR